MSLNTLIGRLGTVLGLRFFPMWVGDALMAAFVALTWVEPTRFGSGVPGDLMALLIFEALAIHSTPFVYVVRAGYLPAWILLMYVPFALAAGALYQAIPAYLTVYFTFRAIWHILWWHGERTGEIAKMARMSTGSAG